MGKVGTEAEGVVREEWVEIELPSKIISAKWLKNTTEISTSKLNDKVKIAIETRGIINGKEVVVSILDASNSEVLKRPKIEINNSEGKVEIEIEKEWVHKELKIEITKDDNEGLNLVDGYIHTKTLKIICCEHAIEKGARGDLIREINIRLAGFGEGGCPLPHDTFDDRTESAVKQFQKDYMELDEVTGIICRDTLEALDQFKIDYNIPFNRCRCRCTTKGQTVTNAVDNSSETNNCQGFGDGSNRGRYLRRFTRVRKDEDGNTIYEADGKTPATERVVEYTTRNLGEPFYAYEYPGMHRSLMWGFRALCFYVEKNTTAFTFRDISSGYRCRNHDLFRSSKTTNHMGKALDIQFSHDGTPVTGQTRNRVRLMTELRDAIHKKLGIEPKSGWAPPANRLAFEPVGTDRGQTHSWLHLDVRTFSRANPSYLADEFFANTLDLVNGENLITLLNTVDGGDRKEINSCEMRFEKKKKNE